MTAERQYPYPLVGVECGEGWKCLYEPLIDLCKLYGITILQIKEKFGGLRFYVTGGEKDLDKLIWAAELESYHICEDCGSHGKEKWDAEQRKYVPNVSTGPSETSSWIRSICVECRKKWDVKRTTEEAAYRAKQTTKAQVLD